MTKIPRPARRGRSSILLVSLVDVLFVLLLFFLLAARAAPTAALPLELAAAAPAVDRVLVVSAEGALNLDGRATSAAAAIAELQDAQAVRLQMHATLSLQALMPLLRQLQQAGIAPVLQVAP